MGRPDDYGQTWPSHCRQVSVGTIRSGALLQLRRRRSATIPTAIFLARIVVSQSVFDTKAPGCGAREGVNRRNRRMEGG